MSSHESHSEQAMLDAVRDVIVSEVEDRLSFNVSAYGKAWTEEHEDTRFIVGDSARLVVERLREIGVLA
jgi:hypothetical protein